MASLTIFNRPPDFEAEVRFLTSEEGGRTGKWGPVKQGYRCDIHLDNDPSDLLWMIWPMFLNEHGQELPMGTVVPQTSKAHFFISSPELRRLVHRQWLREGVRFHLSEGNHRVAACSVTKILSLTDDVD
jgi:hypothetical protein